jgi:hypothetical protein
LHDIQVPLGNATYQLHDDSRAEPTVARDTPKVPRSGAEFRPEGPIEVGHIAETAVERKSSTLRCLSQPRTPDILMRRHTAIEAGTLTSPRTDAERFDLILGITCHAVYHAGQIN